MQWFLIINDRQLYMNSGLSMFRYLYRHQSEQIDRSAVTCLYSSKQQQSDWFIEHFRRDDSINTETLVIKLDKIIECLLWSETTVWKNLNSNLTAKYSILIFQKKQYF